MKLKNKRKSNQPINISQVLVVKPERHSALDISNWITAISQAYRGRRSKLTELYNNLLFDGVLWEAMDKRIRAITNADLNFQKDGKEVEEMWEFMDSPAFEELLREIMLSKFYGKSIVELKFTDKFEIASIDRRHLDTEKKQILINQSDTDGISYEDDDFILNIGNDKDLGLLARTAPHAIFKRNGGADYAQFCELFGIPQLIGTYDPEDENGKVEMEEAFQKRGSAGSVVMSKNSSITSIDAKQVNGAVHKDFLEYCNKEILIATQGQTMTTTDGTSLAQAKVHAETENDIQRADRIFVRRFLNHELKPRLEKRGFPVAGGSFNFVENTDLEALKIKLQIAEKIHTITSDGVDEDYFFEEFGLPRGKEKKENDAQSKEKGIHPPKNSNNKENEENEKDEQKRIKIIAKELTFFQKIKDFFDHAPL